MAFASPLDKSNSYQCGYWPHTPEPLKGLCSHVCSSAKPVRENNRQQIKVSSCKAFYTFKILLFFFFFLFSSKVKLKARQGKPFGVLLQPEWITCEQET